MALYKKRWIVYLSQTHKQFIIIGMYIERDKAIKLYARAVTAFSAFENARREVKVGSNIAMKAMAWNAALNEYCKTTKFLSEAARNLNRSAWAEALLTEQKQSPALSYLHHARNADSHGIEEVTEGMPGALKVGSMFSFGGDSNVILENCWEVTTLQDGSRVMRAVNGNFSTRSGLLVDGWLSSEVPVTTVPEHLRVRNVSDRGVTYEVPSLAGRPEQAVDELLQRAHNWLDGKMKAIDPSK